MNSTELKIMIVPLMEIIKINSEITSTLLIIAHMMTISFLSIKISKIVN